jgi:hypothetical protein
MENNKINSNTEKEIDKKVDNKKIEDKKDVKSEEIKKVENKKPYDLLQGLVYQNLNYII